MKKISAEIVADSVNEHGNRITTMLLTYPRFIHGEVLTHRMFSRNSASSRAIPFEKMVKMVEEDPFIPLVWQKSHKGMQGSEYWGKEEWMIDQPNVSQINVHNCAIGNWLQARDNAVSLAKQLNCKNITKQLCNRLLEPFMWHTVLVTATSWENFFKLRCPKYHYDLEDIYFKSRKDWLAYYKLNCIDNPDSDFDLNEMDWYNINKSQAEIHIQALAEAMWDAMNESTPKTLQSGEWHIPFGDKIEGLIYSFKDTSDNIWTLKYNRLYDGNGLAIKVATARAARLSYMTFDGEIDYKKDIQLHDRLLADNHMSPFEHSARAMSNEEYRTFIRGKCEVNPISEEVISPVLNEGWCNNFKGFIQYRYLIENKI